MASLVAMATREVYRRELLPARARWWLAAAGMCDWFRVLGSKLRPHLEAGPRGGSGGDSRALLSSLGARMFERRYRALRERYDFYPAAELDGRAPALVMAGLYRQWTAPKSAWIFGAMGGAPRGVGEHLRARELARKLTPEARWEEVTTHLGELLIVLTEGLPEHLPHARKILGDICFEMGARYASHMRRFFGMPRAGNQPEQAIEVLRMSEYVFRVNPDHWGSGDAASNTGYLEGNACPWFMRPGWNQAHCGIFGQFQAGISSEFGLRYQLSKTIPKHGGETCRIDLKPIGIRRGKEGPAIPPAPSPAE